MHAGHVPGVETDRRLTRVSDGEAIRCGQSLITYESVNRRQLLRIFSIAAVVGLPGIVSARISLRRSAESIRKYLLEEVPLKNSQQDVIDMLRRNRWLDFEVNELVGFDDQRTSTSGLVGAKHIRANLGEYRGIIFSTNVTVFWGFNQRGELIDVWVWKTTDSF